MDSKPNSDIPANVKYKDSFFTALFSEPEKVLKLYNAISENRYPLDTPIEITTLENVLYQDRYNDLSFIVDGKLVVLVEHQSSINPNMPLRLLIYHAKLCDGQFKGRNIYSSKPVKIPRPEFIVLYNGVDEYPDEGVLRLSDAFCDVPDGHKPNGGPELTARVLNINKGRNEAMVKQSLELDGYTQIVDAIRGNKAAGMSLNEAVDKAVRDCADRGILPGFLKKHGGEVMSMLYAEWNWDEYIAVQREEAVENAVTKERQATAKKALAKGLSVEDAAELADISVDEVRALAGN